jgi:hypothetical protein
MRQARLCKNFVTASAQFAVQHRANSCTWTTGIAESPVNTGDSDGGLEWYSCALRASQIFESSWTLDNYFHAP